MTYDHWKTTNQEDNTLGHCHPRTQSRRLLIVTNYINPPIPTRKMDWSAVTDGYEPGEPVGHGETEAEAVQDLYIQIEMREDDDDQQRMDYELGRP